MKFKAPIYPQVWLVFTAWIAIILAVGHWQTSGAQSELTEGFQSGIRVNVVAAMLFGLTCIGFWRVWRETGFTAIAKGAAWWLLIVPVALIVILSVFGLSHAELAKVAILTVLVNALFVGINEEVMLRGLFFSGAVNRFSFLTACVLTTVVFGAMHLLNFFSTGEIKIVQAVATMFVGLILLAIRVGMGSIIPAIVIHWLWDFATVMTGSVNVEEIEDGSLLQMTPLVILAAPVLFGLTGGIYLWRYSKRLSAEEAG